MKASRRAILSIRGLIGGLAGFGVCYAPFSVAVALVMFVVTDSAPAAPCTSCTVKNTGIEVTVTCSATKLTLTQIYGVKDNQKYLNSAAPLLSYVDTNSGTTLAPYSDTFKNVACGLTDNILVISANSSDDHLSFSFLLSPDSTGSVVTVSTQVKYQSPSSGAPTIWFYAMLPNIQSFKIANKTTAMAMVPQMIGGVLPLSNISSSGLGPGPPLTFPPLTPGATTSGLPTNLNVMEIAEIYDGSTKGGGLFFADLDGSYDAYNPWLAPLQFNLTSGSGSYQIAGYWTALLKLNVPVGLPTLAIGIQPSGDWHNAVDYYVNAHSSSWTFPGTPKWFREAGGIYFVGVAGGGSFLGTFPFTTLGDPFFGIQLFACNRTLTDSTGNVITTGTPKPGTPNLPGHRCLLDVYNDAQTLGTNVIYLGEWWDNGSGNWGYNNRGDWIVAANLGGPDGLKKAVGDIHKKNGKVILYLEPYVVDDTSMVWKKQIPNWQLLLGPPMPSGTAVSCNKCANTDIANTQWQDYLINRAVDLITTTGVDGFFLDSWGWEMNYPVHSSIEDVDYTPQQWTAAALRFVDRLRAAIRAAVPTCPAQLATCPIVMGENNTGQLTFHWDGGSAADLSPWNTLFKEDQGKLLASPIRYAMPNANFFVNGGNLGGLNQVFAAGHNLALGPFWLLNVMDAPPPKAQPQCPGPPPPLPPGCYSAFAPFGNYWNSHPSSYVAPARTLTTMGGTNKKSASVTPTTGLNDKQYIYTTTDPVLPYGTMITAIDGTIDGTRKISLSHDATAAKSVQAWISDYPIPTQIADTTVSGYIKTLMNIRQKYADALVYGKQLNLPATSLQVVPATSATDIVAFMYQGQTYQVLAIVNNGSTTVTSVTVTLDSTFGSGMWSMGVSPASSTITNSSSGTSSVVSIANLSPAPSKSGDKMGGLVILSRACPSSCPGPKAYGDTSKVALMNEVFTEPVLNNWTDWMVSASTPGTPVPSGRWSVSGLTVSPPPGVLPTSLNVQSLNESSLLFYDSFGGGDFTYRAGIEIEFSTALGSAGYGQAGLSFRLSDDQQSLDAGRQGYDAVLTNVPMPLPITNWRIGEHWSTGSVQLLKRQAGAISIPAWCNSIPYDVNPGQAYQLSVSATTSWTASTPSFPSSTTFTVSVDGSNLLSCTDPSPYFSGRFGVNSSNVNASFTCLQANDEGKMRKPCPAPPRLHEP